MLPPPWGGFTVASAARLPAFWTSFAGMAFGQANFLTDKCIMDFRLPRLFRLLRASELGWPAEVYFGVLREAADFTTHCLQQTAQTRGAAMLAGHIPCRL